VEELIAKRYIKALKSGLDLDSLKNLATIFSTLSESFKDSKFISIIESPNVNSKDKLDILLASVKVANSENLNNFIKLLVENKRINIIPAIAEELKKDIAKSTSTYEGVIYSDSSIDTKLIEELSTGLGKKFNASITLASVKNDFNGIKVDVEDLGIEINFSKDRIDNQIIEHIIKAI